MNTTFYQVMTLVGWVLCIIGYFLDNYQNPYASYLQGFGAGLVVMGSLTIILKKRNQKHEASSR
jgi:cyanate permease